MSKNELGDYPQIPYSHIGYIVKGKTDFGYLVYYQGRSYHVARLIHNVMNKHLV